MSGPLSSSSVASTASHPYYEVDLQIRGRVQGVFYRASAIEQARKLGLNGYVKNLPDGSVKSVAQSANKSALEEYVRWCWTGPSHAKVDNIVQQWSVKQKLDYSGFSKAPTG